MCIVQCPTMDNALKQRRPVRGTTVFKILSLLFPNPSTCVQRQCHHADKVCSMRLITANSLSTLELVWFGFPSQKLQGRKICNVTLCQQYHKRNFHNSKTIETKMKCRQQLIRIRQDRIHPRPGPTTMCAHAPTLRP